VKHEPEFPAAQPPVHAGTAAPGPLPLIRMAIAALLCWDARWRERRHLETLTDEALADVGRTRSEIEAEVAKPFWRI
jgi:uncharacterized protein YjiS (DUF1127 family)